MNLERFKILISNPLKMVSTGLMSLFFASETPQEIKTKVDNKVHRFQYSPVR